MIKLESTKTYTPILTIQQVRLIDVFVVAPFCFYVAFQKNISKPVKTGLLILGFSTLIFNGYNYLINKK
jgi:flagellar assembly factor FliW